MNGKRSKLTRRNAEFISQNKQTTYINKIVKRVNIGTIDKPVIQEKIQIVMNECTRKTYQQLKKEYKNV